LITHSIAKLFVHSAYTSHKRYYHGQNYATLQLNLIKFFYGAKAVI